MGRKIMIGMGGTTLADSLPWADRFGKNILMQPGIGGSYGFADLDHDISVMLCHNRLILPEQYTRDTLPLTPIVDAIAEEFVKN